MDLSKAEIVLIRPARAGNVAAACRALKNMGLRTLWLVDPPATLAEREIRSLAYGAWDVLDGARYASSLSQAVAGSDLVAATSGRTLAEAVTPRGFAEAAARRASAGALSVVFGPEASGLTREELALCHLLVHIPSDPRQPSLNLAQAVLLVAYELRLASLAVEPNRQSPADSAGPASANAGELEQTVREFREALLAVGYLDPANPGRILTELRRMLARAAPTRREITLLRGLARQVAWAGRIARDPAGTG